MTGRNLDQIAFRDNLKNAIIPCLIFIIFAGAWVIFDLNVPVHSEEHFGTVLSSTVTPNYKGLAAAIVFIEIEGGRVISTQIPSTVPVPNIGKRVTVVRYVKRFFGDSFGLK